MPSCATRKAVISPAMIPKHQDHRDDEIDRQVPLHHGDGRDGAQEAGQEADRQVDVADDDHQRHAHRQHGDIAGLVEQVADVARMR